MTDLKAISTQATRLVRELSKELEEGNLAIFAGAGFSRAAGFVDWKSLLKPIADDLGLDVEREWDMVTLAQYHCNVNQANRAKLNQLLVTEFCRRITPTENHRILARLPIDTYWTTNYDNLIEQALRDSAKIPDVKYTKEHLATTLHKRDAVVYKMHGDSEHPSKAVLIRDDYERYHIRMEPYITALSGALISKTFLFVGFSFTDPNLEYILSRVRIQYAENQRQHHCILRKPSRVAGEDLADFEYRQRKEELFAGELLRVGIKVTYVDAFDEITQILSLLEQRHKRRTVFISGAAHEYTPFDAKNSERFVNELSKEIIKAELRIISGFGLGIGSAVISGVLEQTIMSGGRLDSDKLVVRPFPQSQSGNRPLPDLWREYRNDMLDHAGIAIFLFGNKWADGKLVDSNGMREEFEIARAKGIFVIPVGATGSMSKTLWDEVIAAFDPKAYPNGAQMEPLLRALGDAKADLATLQKTILTLIKLI